MFSAALLERLGGPARLPEGEVTSFHADVAASAQRRVEDLLLAKVGYLAERTGCRNLCMAGGVALNCVANGRLLREGPFQHLFVQPAAGDAGAALGAGALASRDLGMPPPREALASPLLGPRYADAEIRSLLHTASIPFTDFRGDESGLLDACAARLSAGEVLGWFQGRMEFGPRALGARSILADPRDPAMRERLNRLVKRREAFRPFAPSVTLTAAANWFALDQPSPFMLETCQVKGDGLPAITHIDGSARPQTVDPNVAPRFAALLERFDPAVLVNTSFNVRDEPIVCTPLDALRCFLGTEIDGLALESCLVDRKHVPPETARRVLAAAPPPGGATVSDVVYTFL